MLLLTEKSQAGSIAPTLSEPAPELASLSTAIVGLNRDFIEKQLPRASLGLSFMVFATTKYNQSAGLWGVSTAEFCNLHDITPTIEKGLRNSLIADLVSLGVLQTGVMPFGCSVGYLPSSAFLKLLRENPDIFPSIIGHERKSFSPSVQDFCDSSCAGIEQRWLKALANCVLRVNYGAGLSVQNLNRLLPDFDNKSDKLPRLLEKLHELELISICEAAPAEPKDLIPDIETGKQKGQSSTAVVKEIFLSSDFFSALEDTKLTESLKDKSRKSITLSREPAPKVQITAPKNSKPPPVKPEANKFAKLKEKMAPKLIKFLPTAPTEDSALAGLEGNVSGKNVRQNIIEAIRAANQPLSSTQITSALGEGYTGVQYHLKLMVDNGVLEASGEARARRYKIKTA